MAWAEIMELAGSAKENNESPAQNDLVRVRAAGFEPARTCQGTAGVEVRCVYQFRHARTATITERPGLPSHPP